MNWYKVQTGAKKELQDAIAKYNLPHNSCYIPGLHTDLLGPWNNTPDWYIDLQGNHWHESMFSIVRVTTDLCTCDVCIQSLKMLCKPFKPLKSTIITDDETISEEDY